MNKDCASVRKSLPKYLRGHLFKYEQIRIARHLNSCAVCRSEYQALKKVADTRRLLKDITPPEGFVLRLKAGAAGLARVRMLMYRPLWLLLIIGLATVVYLNIFAPHRDIEIENIERSLPPPAPATSAPTGTPAMVSASTASAAVYEAAAPMEHRKRAESDLAPEPLVITIAPAGEQAVRRINEALRSHGQLRKMKFTDSVREISGTMTARELLSFFNRIDEAGKVAYSRKRFESYPETASIPFVMKMKSAPKPVDPTTRPAPPAAEPAAPGTHAESTPSSSAEADRSAENGESLPEQHVSGQ